MYKARMRLSLGVIFMLLVLMAPANTLKGSATTHLPVTVYKDINFESTAQEFDVGSHDMSELTASGGVGNDAISSLRVAQGYKVTLYVNSGYAGASLVITADNDNLKNLSFNDKVSSLIIETTNPVDATCIQAGTYDDAFKLSMLGTFAPRVWMASGETYWASSVEWAQPYLQRYLNTTENKYCYETVETLSSPTAKLDFFGGNQSSAVAYAFWSDKEYNNIDLSFWQFSPYDAGKVVIGSEFGVHVGDWEHITVRLAKFTYNGVNYVKPIMVVYPFHTDRKTYNWADVPTVTGTNHPIAYSAKGSHGMWRDSGNHVYQDIVIAKLTDECSEGTAWDTWNVLRTFEYDIPTATGRGLGTTTWPSYFNTDYTNANGGAVYRWGNTGQGSVFGQAIRADGPRGPEAHFTDATLLR